MTTSKTPELDKLTPEEREKIFDLLAKRTLLAHVMKNRAEGQKKLREAMQKAKSETSSSLKPKPEKS